MLHLRIAAPQLLLHMAFLLGKKSFTTHGRSEIRGRGLLTNKCGHIYQRNKDNTSSPTEIHKCSFDSTTLSPVSV